MPVLRYYKTPGLTSGAQDGVIKKIQCIVGASFRSLTTELCFYIDTELGIYILVIRREFFPSKTMQKSRSSSKMDLDFLALF